MSDWAKGMLFPPMAVATLPSTLRTLRPGAAAMLLGVLLAVLAAGMLLAQIEGNRGIQPVASTSDIEISGIAVETTGKTAEEARLAGWQLAQRKAWEKAGGPEMSDGQIEAMVAAVVIEAEQIGPKRYIATLGVIFDRTRAGQFIGGTGGASAAAHSAPLLVIPVLHSGGTAQVYEVQGPWQQAWAQFRAGTSPIDYVRPVGAGGDSLLLTAGQSSRRSRTWWRNVLDQFGAADVLIPVARLERQWPGGPVRGTFTARFGPDNTFLESFTLTANDEAALPKMLAQAVARIDAAYARALDKGLLKPDPTLNQSTGIDASLAALIAQGHQAEQAAAGASPDAQASAAAGADSAPVGGVNSFSVHFASPDAAAVDAALAAVRGAPGVQSASTTSLAMGGTSVMRVGTTGDLQALAGALRARGWQVTAGSNALSIRR